MIEALLEMLVLHTLDGRPLWVRPEQIISLAPSKDNTLLTKGVGCIVSLTDAKFVSIKETCEEVREMMGRTL